MSNSPYISLNEAAELTGRAKSTISKALKNGKVSFVSQDPKSKQFQIDPAEVLRVFPKKQEAGNVSLKETEKNTNGNSNLDAEVQALRQQIDAVQQERDRERDQLQQHIEDLRGRVERAERKEDQLQALLTDQREKFKGPAKRGFWARLVGQGLRHD
jgi:chromosome segregation ATPase